MLAGSCSWIVHLQPLDADDAVEHVGSEVLYGDIGADHQAVECLDGALDDPAQHVGQEPDDEGDAHGEEQYCGLYDDDQHQPEVFVNALDLGDQIGMLAPLLLLLLPGSLPRLLLPEGLLHLLLQEGLVAGPAAARPRLGALLQHADDPLPRALQAAGLDLHLRLNEGHWLLNRPRGACPGEGPLGAGAGSGTGRQRERQPPSGSGRRHGMLH
mmetsp:Transcript_69590/g.181279  ORF Transcript_69590/g.181279 Transcript_69590/m.181279 type:complete len:213 (-) Transcript_69590:65-703(-)